MDDCKEVYILSVTTTLGSREDATRIAREAVAAHLAACVQIEAIESVYVWEGKLCQEPEHRLTFKTAAHRQEALEHWLGQQHPYALPQILSSRCMASQAYHDWVHAQVD